MFLDHFWPFLVIIAWWGFFPKTPAVTHNYIWAPNNMLSFRKKLMSSSRENLQTDGRTDGRMEGWKDERTDRPYFLAEARGPKSNEIFIALFLLWIGKPNIAQVCWPQWSIILFLDVLSLKHKINIIILPTDLLETKSQLPKQNCVIYFRKTCFSGFLVFTFGTV